MSALLLIATRMRTWIFDRFGPDSDIDNLFDHSVGPRSDIRPRRLPCFPHRRQTQLASLNRTSLQAKLPAHSFQEGGGRGCATSAWLPSHRHTSERIQRALHATSACA
jgi:hypothetical protein